MPSLKPAVTLILSAIVVLAFCVGLIVQRAIDSDRLLPEGSTTYCPSESSCKYDYFDKQPHIFRTGE